MEIAIFIFYLLLFLFFVSRIPFFKIAELPVWVIPLLFLIKIISGIAYALFYKLPRYYEGSDTWRFFRLSIKEKDWLLKDPIAFTKDLFVHGYQQSGNLFSGENSYWNDLKSNIPVKLLAIMNVFSNNGYYTNVIFFNFLYLFGLVALYKVAASIYQSNKWLLLAAVFLLPSTLFWCSGIHKDGLILSATGLIVYLFYQGINNGISFLHWVALVLLLTIIFTLRNYVALALVPALFAWWLASKKPSLNGAIFSAIYLVGIISFFLLPTILPAADLPGFIVNKQEEFKNLEGGSIVAVQQLEPNFLSFLRYLPTALDIAFLRPHPSEIKNIIHLPAIVEIFLMIIMLVFAVLSLRKTHIFPATLFLIVFGVSILLIAGYTITLSGAIVRYRSFALPFIFIALLGQMSARKYIK